MSTRSSELPADESGRQYHVGVAPGDVAPFVLLTGDIERARKIAERFDEITVERSSREYRTYTGTHRGLAVTALATGMGPDNTEMALVELSQVVESPTLLRVGSCGSLHAHIELGHLVISQAAVRFENTSEAYAPIEYPAAAHPEVLMALLRAAGEHGHPWHAGITATLPSFYAAQGRDVPGFGTQFPDRPEQLAELGVANMEMETSCLFTLASVRGFRAGAICAAYANRVAGEFTSPEAKVAGENAAIDVALEAVHHLAAMDAARNAAGAPLWHPGLG